MKTYKAVPRKAMLTSALLAVLAGPAWAQDTTRDGAASSSEGLDPATLDTVQVTGIRGSLTSSMNLKRDSQGVVDGIVAEDIGKFPDTNLAESCSASPASRSSVVMVKARRSPRVASARSSTW